MFQFSSKPGFRTILAIFVGLCLLSAATVLTLSVNAAPDTIFYRTLNKGDKLIVTSTGCILTLDKSKNSRIALHCRTTGSPLTDPDASSIKTNLTLHAGDKLVVKRNACMLRITKSLPNTIAIECVPIAGIFTRVSISSTGAAGNGDSYESSISADGRFVTFASYADNLVPNDLNNSCKLGDQTINCPDVFLRDTAAHTTTLVSVSLTGTQGNGESSAPAISADGRYIAFHSYATNLVKQDVNNFCQNYDGSTNCPDIFIHDLQSGKTRLVSIASDGTQTDGTSGNPAISGNGRYIAFTSKADNLVPNDTNEVSDVFVHDMTTGQTTRVSVASDGTQANDKSESSRFAISADGRFVIFQSAATNLIANDTNDKTDLFVHDMTTGQTSRVAPDTYGAQATISGNGNFVVFKSSAQALAPDDTNNAPDLFVRNLTDGTTIRITNVPEGTPNAVGASETAISSGGRYIVFLYFPDNPPTGDPETDIFLYDARSRETTRIFAAFGNSAGDCAISGNGRYTTFQTDLGLASRDRNYYSDIYLYQR